MAANSAGSRVTPAPYENARFRQVPYDLVKELTMACLGIGILVLILAAVFSTPDVPALSAQQVAQQDPILLIQTELRELGEQSRISTYGPPYNHGTVSIQALGSFSPQTWAGIQIPLNTAKVDVLKPLSRVASLDPPLAAALRTWQHASPAQQSAWIANVQAALKPADIQLHKVVIPPTPLRPYGPVPALATGYLNLAQSGLLEAAIDGENGPSPILNRTKSLLLFEGQVDHIYAKKLNMLGEDWGVIKETGDYPGAVWLWFYTLLYQIPPYSTSSAGDLLVVLTVIPVTLILMLIPFIPGLRSIPRWLGVYKWIWRDYYREQRQGGGHDGAGQQ
jgi:hypothetical protein